MILRCKYGDLLELNVYILRCKPESSSTVEVARNQDYFMYTLYISINY